MLPNAVAAAALHSPRRILPGEPPSCVGSPPHLPSATTSTSRPSRSHRCSSTRLLSGRLLTRGCASQFCSPETARASFALARTRAHTSAAAFADSRYASELQRGFELLCARARLPAGARCGPRRAAARPGVRLDGVLSVLLERACNLDVALLDGLRIANLIGGALRRGSLHARRPNWWLCRFDIVTHAAGGGQLPSARQRRRRLVPPCRLHRSVRRQL